MRKYEIYVGYDPNEGIAFDVLRYSIEARTSEPYQTSVLPLSLPNITNIFNRPIEQRGKQLWCPISNAPMSTEFAISRFCIPWLQESKWALFVDSDMVCLADIKELFELADDKYAVMCVKHKHIPSEEEKFHDSGRLQTIYPRKNWSSCVLWNGTHPANKRLTLEDVNTWPGRDLHAFKWLSDEEIGEIPQEWNFLVGVNEGNLEEQKMLHYTNGCAFWPDWVAQDTDRIWNEEYDKYKINTGINVV